MHREADRYDVLVIGAGAAGLVAAAQAAVAVPGTRVLLLEKQNKTGTKILMSGGTRCNLTHDADDAAIMRAFGRPGRFLRQALASFSAADTVAMFHRLGVPTKVEATGKVFPTSNRAVDVRDALLRQAVDCGVRIETGQGVERIEPLTTGGGFRVQTRAATWQAGRVIVTAGGRSWPACGTTGDGYGWLAGLGHRVTPTRPSLVPLVGGSPWTRGLSGLTLEQVRLRVDRREGKRGKRPLAEREGGFLFTHQGFSGPAVMDVSKHLTVPQGTEKFGLQADFLPTRSDRQLRDWWEGLRDREGAKSPAVPLGQWIPKRLAAALVELALGAGTEPQLPAAQWPRGAMHRLLELLKRCDLPVTGSRGLEKAEVTAGGVDLAEVDPRTMQSRRVPGLFIAGEILDLDGWIGGYNFQSAFSTGYVAGQAAAKLEASAFSMTG